MGEIAERYRARMDAIRDQVPSTHARLTGRVWKQLLKQLEAARPPVSDESRRSSRTGDASPA
jgi:hypothetical protein